MGFLSSIGSVLNSVTGITSQQNKTYKQQQQAMNAQNAYNTQMWNAQNEYNSPTAQLARMREAGIDVNPTSYALGTGNLSNTATFVGSENGFSGAGSPAGNPISMALGVANGIADIQNKKQSNRLLKEQTINANEEGDRLIQSIESGRLENEIKRHNLKVARKHGLPVGDYPTFMGTKVNPEKLFDMVPGSRTARRLGEKIASYIK